MTTKRIICALALGALLSSWTINGQAQTGERTARPKPSDVERCPPVEQSPVGAWLASFTEMADQSSQALQQFYYVQPFHALISFNDDGVLVDAPPSFDIERSCEAIECAAPAVSRVTPSVGVGAWVRSVEGIYTLSYVHQLHDSEGRNLGELRTHATILVDEGTQTFSGEFVTEMLDERGRQVMSCWGKIAGQRLAVEEPPVDGYGQ